MTNGVTPGVTNLHLEAATWAARLGYGDKDCCRWVAFLCDRGRLNQLMQYPDLMREYLAETRN